MTQPKSVFELDPAELLHLNGELLAAIREELGLTPEEMAQRLQCHPSTLNRYENDKMKFPLHLAQRVLEVLDEERARRSGENRRFLPALVVVAPPPPPPEVVGATIRVGPLAPGVPGGTQVPASFVKLEALVELEVAASTELPFGMPPLYVGVPAGMASSGKGGGGSSTPASSGTVGSTPASSSAAAPAGGSGGGAASSGVTKQGGAGMFSAPARFATLMGGVAAILLLGSCLARVAPLRGQPMELTSEACFSTEPGGERAPGQDLAEGDGEGAQGEEAAPKRRLMPKKPYAWQKRAPCDGATGETEKVGGCWMKTEVRAPCASVAVEDEDGVCFVPIPAKPPRPNSTSPEKP